MGKLRRGELCFLRSGINNFASKLSAHPRGFLSRGAVEMGERTSKAEWIVLLYNVIREQRGWRKCSSYICSVLNISFYGHSNEKVR